MATKKKRKSTSVADRGKQIGKEFKKLLPSMIPGAGSLKTVGKIIKRGKVIKAAPKGKPGDAKTIKDAANKIKIERAKIKAKAAGVPRGTKSKAGAERIKRSETGIRATGLRGPDPKGVKQIADVFKGIGDGGGARARRLAKEAAAKAKRKKK